VQEEEVAADLRALVDCNGLIQQPFTYGISFEGKPTILCAIPSNFGSSLFSTRMAMAKSRK